MIGLLVLLSVLAWGTASIAIAIWIGRRISSRAVAIVVTLLLIPTLFGLPLADELVGKIQFDRLCDTAEKVTVYRTVPVGEVLYTPEGKWRQDLLVNKRGKEALRELSELSKRIEKLLRFEQKPLSAVSAAIPIYGIENRIYLRDSGDLLAAYRSYTTPGGWLSRNFEKPAIVRSQCIPRERRGLEKRLLRFDN